jgi:hypothetical protein
VFFLLTYLSFGYLSLRFNLNTAPYVTSSDAFFASYDSSASELVCNAAKRRPKDRRSRFRHHQARAGSPLAALWGRSRDWTGEPYAIETI